MGRYSSPSNTPRVREQPGVLRLFRYAYEALRARGALLFWVIVGSQFFVHIASIPLLGWLFHEALRSAGMVGLDLGSLRIGGQLVASGGFLLAIILIIFWITSLQYIVLIIILCVPRDELSLTRFLSELRRVVQKLLRPSALPMLLYLLILIPLTGFGFMSALTRGIAVPRFVIDEILKTPWGGPALTLVIAVLVLINLRLAVSFPLFVTSDLTASSSLRTSWRMTRGFRSSATLGISVVLVTFGAALIAGIVVFVTAVPTAITDAIAPAASPIIAAYSLGVALTAAILLSGLVSAAIIAVLLAYIAMRQNAVRRPLYLVLLDGSVQARHQEMHRKGVGLLSIACAVLALALGTSSIGTLRDLANHPDTLVIAHRGFTESEVENTIGALEAASAVGVDFVEMDVMQAKDGFVVIHDADLQRLAGINAQVKDMTVEELGRIVVSDGRGNSGSIASLSAYVRRAQELNTALLIEVKLGGLDTPDHVDRLVAELDALDALDGNIFHTLDPKSVARLKYLRPDTTVGYILPLAGGGVPQTVADFIVAEQTTATEDLQHEAWDEGLAFFVWTVNDDKLVRFELRRDVDAIITDRSDLVLETREQMDTEKGLLEVLVDALKHFVTID